MQPAKVHAMFSNGRSFVGVVDPHVALDHALTMIMAGATCVQVWPSGMGNLHWEFRRNVKANAAKPRPIVKAAHR